MFDLIAIGDTVIDTFVPLSEIKISVIDGQRSIILPLGTKVPVGPGQSLIGGNAANSAVGASRLKLKTAIYTNVGNKDDDEADDRIKARFKKEGVDIRYIVENANFVSNHHIVLTCDNERTILVYHQPWKFELPDLERAKWIYFTSLSPSFVESNIVDQVINYIERTGGQLVYQPGTFQLQIGLKKNSRLLSLTELFIVNLQEAKIFLGYKLTETQPIKRLLKGLSDLGPKKVVITDSKNGSYGFDGVKYFKLGIFPAKLVETTGAGDAFATATVAGLFYGKDLSEAVRWGAANSSAVIEHVGSQAGLLTYSQIQDKLKENSDILAKTI